jgi:hypothetical protein
LKEVVGEQFVNDTNKNVPSGAQQINLQVIEKEKLKFTGDNGLAQVSKYAEEQISENRTKIDIKRKEEKK